MPGLTKDAFHSIILAENIKAFYNLGYLTDVVLSVEDVQIDAHRVILAAASPYFKARFKNDFGDNSSKIVEFHDVSAEAMTEIVRYIYTGEIQLTKDNILPIMELEDLLQVGTLRPLISHYLTSCITLDNCWTLKACCDLLGYQDLADYLFLYIRSHFKTLLESESFLLAPLTVLVQCLESGYLVVPDEDTLCLRLCEWIAHDLGHREPYLSQLVELVDVNQCVKFKETLDKISVVLEGLREPKVLSDWKAKAEESRGDNLSPGGEPRFKQALTNVVLALGGYSDSVVLGTVECLTSPSYPWKMVLPRTTQDHTSMAVSKNRPIPVMKRARWGPASASSQHQVFLLGGWSGFGDGTELTSVECYDVTTNTWSWLPELPEVASSSAAAYLNGNLYCTGGFSGKSGPTNHVWMLNLDCKSWKRLSPMLEARREHGLVALHGALYAIGGLGSVGKTLRSAERYDPSRDSWISIAPMNLARMRHGCVVIDNWIYVIRGKVIDSDDLQQSMDKLLYNERYDSMTNAWFPCSTYPMAKPISQSGVRSVALGKNIITTGGYFGATLEVYNSITGLATDGPSMNRARLGHALASVLLPLVKKPPI